jgi:hypothetical protein
MDVTGLTATRMLAIEAASIVGGSVNGSGHLILTKYSGATIDSGSVIGPTGPTGPTGPVPEATADGRHYTRRNGVWVPLEEQVAADIVKALYTKTQAVVTGGPVGGTAVNLAIMTIPAVIVNSKLEVSAFWNAYTTVAADSYEFWITVDGVTKAIQHVHFIGTNDRQIFSLPSSTFQDIPDGNGVTINVKCIRVVGSGTAVQQYSGLVTATTCPA